MNLIANSDTQLGLNSYFWLIQSLYAWNPLKGLGAPSLGYHFYSLNLQLILSFFMKSYASIAGLCAVAVGFFLVTYATIILVGKQLFNKKPNRPYAVLMSIFFILNPLLISFTIRNLSLLLGYLLMYTAVLLLFVSLLRNKLYLAILSVTVATFSIIDFHSFIYFVLGSAILGVTYCLLLMRNKESLKPALRIILVAAIVLFLLNAHWILYSSFRIFQGSMTEISGEGVAEVNKNVLDLVNKTNHLWRTITYTNGDYMFFIPSPLKWALGFISSVLFLFTIYVILSFKPVSRIQTLVFRTMSVSTALLLFLTIGPKEPIGIFSFLFNHFSPFQLFRDFYKYHRLLLIFQLVLLGIFLLSDQYKVGLKKLFCSFMLVGTVLRVVSLYYALSYVNQYRIPDDYYGVSALLNSEVIDYRIMIFPQVSWYDKYTWSNPRYDMQDPMKYLIERPLLSVSLGYSLSPIEKINYEISNSLLDREYVSLSAYLKKYGISHLLVRKDILAVDATRTDITGNKPDFFLHDRYTNALSGFSLAREEYTSQNFDVYRVGAEKISGAVYNGDANAPVSYTSLNSSTHVIQTFLTSNITQNYRHDTSWMLSRDFYEFLPKCNFVDGYKESIFKRIACDAQTGVIALLHFHNFQRPVYSQDLYENKWPVAESDIPNYLVVYYMPQAVLSIGILVSLIVMSLSILYLVVIFGKYLLSRTYFAAVSQRSSL